jgi:hypothetical protein
LSREVQTQQIDNHSLCLLHAIMAAGAHFSDLPVAKRLSKSSQNRKHQFSPLSHL